MTFRRNARTSRSLAAPVAGSLPPRDVVTRWTACPAVVACAAAAEPATARPPTAAVSATPRTAPGQFILMTISFMLDPGLVRSSGSQLQHDLTCQVMLPEILRLQVLKFLRCPDGPERKIS